MVRSFRWSDRYAVYVPELDAEHRDIFQMGMKLEQAAAAELPTEEMSEAVRALVGTIEDHFSHEERLMKAANYPGRDWHKKQHNGMRRALKQYARRVAEGDRQAPEELLEYLCRWLHDHTAVTDRMMTASLRNFQRQHTTA